MEKKEFYIVISIVVLLIGAACYLGYSTIKATGEAKARAEIQRGLCQDLGLKFYDGTPAHCVTRQEMPWLYPLEKDCIPSPSVEITPGVWRSYGCAEVLP